MRNYRTNVEDYLNKDILEEKKISIGDDIGYVPFEETEADFCYLESIKSIQDAWVITLRVENEFSGERYTKEYIVNAGFKMELNAFGDAYMCFFPPEKIPVLVEITSINMDAITLKTIGVLEEYAADLDIKTEKFVTLEQR